MTLARIRRVNAVAPCGRGWLREAKAGEGFWSIDSPQPLICHGLRPRHLLPQAEKGRSRLIDP